MLYKALVLTSKDDRNETLILLRKYELEVRAVIPRKLEKGEVIYVKVEHVDPFYDRLIVKDVPDFKPRSTAATKKAFPTFFDNIIVLASRNCYIKLGINIIHDSTRVQIAFCCLSTSSKLVGASRFDGTHGIKKME